MTPDKVAAAFELFRAGRFGEAEKLFLEVLGVQPGHPGALHGLGQIASETGNYKEAAGLLARALAADRSRAEVQCDLGSVLTADHRPQEALPFLRRALRGMPGVFLPHHALAVALLELGRLDEAEASARRAIKLAPRQPAPHMTLGRIFEARGWYQAAVDAYRILLDGDPGHLKARARQASLLVQLGRAGEARALFETLVPAGDRSVQSGYLLSLLYGARTDTEVRAAHGRIGAAVEAAAARLAPLPRPRDGRRLRLGYLSADFRLHSVAFFFEAVLAHHDRAKFEVFCYHGNTFSDDVTARLKARAERWIECGQLDDEALAALIRADGIDLLVDLAGWTGGGRVGVFARKPARLQVAWLGYPAATGLKAIDARISDSCADPPELDHPGERVVRLPASYFCYSPPRYAPALSPPPCLKKGAITFGSFNTFAKVSDDCVALWARALARTPNARLLLKAKALNEPATREQVEARFAAHGVRPERLVLRGWSPKIAEHLAAYREVDVALDTFPYNGATTTCDALWMGVPVVSLAGERHASRMGLSILSAAGRGEWCAHDAAHFAQIAAALAASPAALAEIRNAMRSRLSASALFDAGRFTAALEAALERLASESAP